CFVDINGTEPALAAPYSGPLLPLPSHVVQVEQSSPGSGEVAAIFDQDVTWGDIAAAVASLRINGIAVDSAVAATGVTLVLNMFDNVSPGDPWTWTTDAGQASPRIDLPASGAVVFA